MRRRLTHSSLNLVVLSLFLICLGGQTWAGWLHYNEEQRAAGHQAIDLLAYCGSAHFAEAVFENWESEFLQMGLFVWLTSFLIQKGSAESNPPAEERQPEQTPLTAESPWAARQGGWIRWLYSRSLVLALLSLFALSFLGHAQGGAREYSQWLVEHDRAPVTLWQYLGSSRFWFESLQNWQSEFLAVASLSLLSIWLRQQNSPESKPVNKPHHQTGAD